MMRRQKWLVRALTATSSVALLYMPQLACGQTATDNPTTSAKQLESAEIVVTAQRRAERAQDIPMTVNSASAERLAEANINSAVEIGKIVPAAQIIDNNGGVEPFIRGIGSNLNTIGADSSNAIYIDGVYQTRLSPILLTLNNVQRIEVLKGPQGTLFGRNSTGGLIQIITREPVPGDTPHVDVKAGFANYNTASASGYVSDSVSDKVAVDVSGVYRDQGSGWGRNLVTGLDTYTKSEYAIRSKIVFAPSSDTKIVVAGFYSHGKGDMGELINVQFGTVARSGIPDGSGLIPITGNYYDRISTAPTFDSSRTYGGSITASTSIGFAQVKNIMSYTNIRDQVTQDIDNTKLNYFVNDNRGYQRTFTNELQLLSKPSSAVQWVAGLFYLDSTFGYNPQLLYGSFIGGSLVITSNARTRSYAAYAQATVPISSRLKLTAGGRFSHDNLSAGGQEEFEGLGVIAPYSSASNQFDSGLWKFVLSYNASSDLMLYISQSRGAKAGQYNLLPFSPTAIRPERMDAYEIGVKSQLLDRAVLLNMAGFYYKLSDLQVQGVSSVGTPVTNNAAKARIYGIEGETEIRLSKELHLRGSATWLDAKYTDFPGAAFYYPVNQAPYGVTNPVQGNAAGNRLSQAPGFSFNLGAQWRIPVGDNNVTVNTNYAWQSRTYFSTDNFLSQNGYGRLDARIEYQLSKERLAVGLWASNLTNTRYYVFMTAVQGPIGPIGVAGRPREWGADVRFNF